MVALSLKLIFTRKEIKMPRKTSTSKYVGDCSPSGIIKQAVKTYKISNVKNPTKTGNIAVDLAAGQIPFVKQWNQGFNLGKLGFIAEQTYKNTKKNKK